MSNNDQQIIETMQNIGGLLFRRLTNELDIQEQIALDNWLDQLDPVSRQFFEDCADWDQLQPALQVMYSFDEEAALADLQKKIDFGVAADRSVIEIAQGRHKYRVYWIAAAVLIAVIGTAVFYTLNKRKTDIASLPVAERYHNDVNPGGDKAVLELADGQKIVLDNASNGELAQQGRVSVIKSDSGQVVYKVGKSGDENSGTISFNTISTPKGGQYQVILPDGSKVWLNAASSLRFPTSFAGNTRNVELMGEGYFQIVKDKSRPFHVQVSPLQGMPATAGRMEVEVLGTEFDLMAYADEDHQATTLVNGEVLVRMGAQQLALKPDQQGILNKQNSSLHPVNNPNIEDAIAWKEGVFQFHDASIQSIMRQVSRWYDIEVDYSGELKQTFNGTIPRQVNLSTVLKILEGTGGVHFRIDGKKVTVFP